MNLPASIVALCAICLLPIPVKCADTSLRWFLSSPWIHSPTDSGGISLIAHVPVIPQPMDQPGIFTRFGNPGFRTPQAKEVRGFAIPLVRLLLPLTEESELSLAYTPTGIIQWNQERKQEPYSSADSSGFTRIHSHGWMNSSQQVDAQWSVLQFKYSISVSEFLDLSLVIERHTASLVGEGTANGNAIVEWESQQAESGIQEFGGDNLNSSWTGQYSGSAWSAGFSTRLGRFLYYGQMGLKIKMKGEYHLTQRLPFYFDSVSLEPNALNAEEWEDNGNRDRILAWETQSQDFVTNEPITFRIPQMHQIGLILLPWLTIDYTYRTGHFRTSVVADSGSATMDYRRFAAYDINLNHLFLTHVHTEYFQSELGLFWIHKRMEPVTSVCLRLPWKPISWSTQIDVLPWVRIFFGVAYAL